MPPGSGNGANPRSIVIPRRFSSSQRSVSTPVRAFTSAVLPWSMWPAVPTTKREAGGAGGAGGGPEGWGRGGGGGGGGGGDPRATLPDVYGARLRFTAIAPRLVEMVPDEAGDEPPMGRGMRGIERGQWRLFIIQGDEIAIGLRRQLGRCLRGRRRAFRAEHATFGNAECDGPRNGGAVSDTGVQLRREAEDPDEQPQPAHGCRIGLSRLGSDQRIQSPDERLVGGRQGCGRGHLQHHFGQRRRAGKPAHVIRQAAPELDDVERGECLELARLFVIELRHTFAQRLERRAERAPGPQHALGDRALHAVVARGQAHDLGGLAVAVGSENDSWCRNETHEENIADASISSPSTMRGPDRLKYADASRQCTAPARPCSRVA